MAINWREIAGGFDQHEPEWYHASGYEIAVKNGYRGTKEQWLDANIAAQDDGEAALQEDESGGVMVVHLTVDWDNDNATTADKTVNEICAAVRAGAIVFADIPDDDYHEFLSLYRANADPEGDMSLNFIQVDRFNSSFVGIRVTGSGTADDPDADLWTYSDF